MATISMKKSSFIHYVNMFLVVKDYSQFQDALLVFLTKNWQDIRKMRSCWEDMEEDEASGLPAAMIIFATLFAGDFLFEGRADSLVRFLRILRVSGAGKVVFDEIIADARREMNLEEIWEEAKKGLSENPFKITFEFTED